MLTLSFSSPPFPMESSCTHSRKSKVLEHSAKESCSRDHDSNTKFPPGPKELSLRTSLLRDSVKRRIFAYMDEGDRSADIEIKSGLSHPTVKLYRRMWNEEKYNARRRSKKSSRRNAWTHVLPFKLFQLPFHLKSASDHKPGLIHVAKGIVDNGKQKNRAASGLKRAGHESERRGCWIKRAGDEQRSDGGDFTSSICNLRLNLAASNASSTSSRA